MKLKQLGANRAALELANGTEVYFSYSTPVAAFIPGKGFAKTDKLWSRTTSKHIGQFLKECGAATVTEQPQAFFDALVK